MHDRIGSPPQVRGKVRVPADVRGGSGITPAGAGKRVFEMAKKYYPRDHPRGCGEKGMTSHKKENLQGSPPQVRGKVSYLREILVLIRITPAGAGKSN